MKKVLMTIGAATMFIAVLPATAQTVNQREVRQHQRIKQGVRSGQLTPQEARRLRFLEMRLRRTEARMRWRNGGRLTPAERSRLREMQRRDSAEIYRLRHNNRHY